MGGSCCSSTERKDFPEDRAGSAPIHSSESLPDYFTEHRTNMSKVIRRLYELHFKHANLIEVRVVQTNLVFSDMGHLSVLLPHLTGLTEISLVRTSLNGAGCKVIMPALAQRGETLDSVCFNNNHIGDEGAEAVAAALPKLRRMHKLMLDGNEVTGKGTEAISKALSMSLHLGVLSLQGNRISAKAQLSLITAVSNQSRIHELSLKSNKEGISVPSNVRSDLRVSADLIN